MASEGLLVRARREAGLTQDEVARRAHTSRPTLSAYEHGRKSPTLETTERLLEATGHRLEAVPVIDFRHRRGRRGGGTWVPNRLWRLPVGRALRSVVLPVHLNWSESGRQWELGDRRQRARLYEVVLREGSPDDLLDLVDGALLVDLWDDLVLPPDVRAVWEPVIAAERGLGER